VALTARELFEILQTGDGWFDSGEPVDELSHALQTAGLALAAGADDDLVVAAALHDIGRLPDLAERSAHRPHEMVGAHACVGVFGRRVAWLIAAHVPAKRYLVATDVRYAASLSSVSRQSLADQGGPMRAEEVAAFGRNRWAQDAVRLRRWDDFAKTPGALTPSLAELEALLVRSARSTYPMRRQC
jgi:predicted HD phosphohydrolase